MYNAHSVTQITNCGEYLVKNKHIDLLITVPQSGASPYERYDCFR